VKGGASSTVGIVAEHAAYGAPKISFTWSEVRNSLQLAIRPFSLSAIARAADRATVLARVLTVIYFLFFILMPWYTARDKTKPVPQRLT
jgi:RsiW-degrading membrane proteinase PrsW (M82 family)